ncbi:dihydrofolate reductase [Erysipelothrix sp. HDW6C]|uniref:dihydrofolate reductase family protein n=1 Tax=Erysipelothrix sp. HDW6C TaxID=2714930 RepID=UPI00140C4FF5|nr:dihydrofolate reductase family protein [Erysipelothrix sp. HDW6C]QIK70778.1 dihydrofolate reductase [Erysipelothrix sp. HDW6C]
MKRKLILYIATSLDGMIADSEGNIDWLTDALTITEADDSYDTFYKSVDTVIMGSTTFKQVTEVLSPEHYPYEAVHSYVFTSQPAIDSDSIKFVNGDIVAFIETLKKQDGKDIWLVGGASLVTPLVNANLIDTYMITLIPTILGKGIPLFDNIKHRHNVKIQESRLINGMLAYTAIRQ